jgi:hypothetical protein
VTAAERLDGVDLRVGIPDGDTARTAMALGVNRAKASECVVHLLEDFSSSPGQLGTAGVTARLMEIPRASEVTVQLRSVRRAQLSPDWLGFYSDDRHHLRIAEEWTLNQRIMTASMTARLDAAIPVLTALPDPNGTRLGGERLSAMQRDFLAICTGLVVEDDRLELLGPILERVWRLRLYDLNFLVRRWTARKPSPSASLDLMDLEKPSSEADAPFLFPALLSLARRQEVDPGEDVDPIMQRAVSWLSGPRR